MSCRWKLRTGKRCAKRLENMIHNYRVRSCVTIAFSALRILCADHTCIIEADRFSGDQSAEAA